MIYFTCERCKTETLDRFGGLCIKCDTKIRGSKMKTWQIKVPMMMKRILILIGRFIKGKVKYKATYCRAVSTNSNRKRNYNNFLKNP